MLPSKLIDTLRFRLTLWNSLVVFIAAVLALFAVREGMRMTIEHEARELLRDEVTELELAVTESFPDMHRIHEQFDRKVLGHSQHNWFACLIDAEGHVVWKSKNFPEQCIEDKLQRTASSPFVFEKTSSMLLVRHSVRTQDQTRFIVVLGEPTQFIKNDVWNLTKIMLMIGAALLLVAPMGGYLLARRATQPVREIIRTTRSLNPAQLDNRLNIRGTGDELDQISVEINSFVDQISKYLRSHREFIANAAHELRSPLTAIQTSVEVSLGQDRTLAEYREELETVSEQCEHLRHLVNQLLELAESDTAVQNTAEVKFDLAAMVRKSIDVFDGIAEEKGVAINANLPTEVFINGNESKLRQVVNNLYDNALKFTPAGGQIDVLLEQTRDTTTLTIRDTGPGVPDSELAKIFDRFYQVDAARTRDNRRGNGLGLSISQAIVKMHDGTITAENRPTTGMQMTIELPSNQE